jgi:uracil-DNA glycosylase
MTGCNLALEPLLHEVRRCRMCTDLPLGPRPLLQASSTSTILIAGQAPGRRTHNSGIPFDDASGNRLRSWLGIDRETFHDARRIAILPMSFCYPGTGTSGDLPPRKECAPAWREQFLARMPSIRLTILVGMHAQRWHLGSDCGPSLTDNVLRWAEFWPSLMPLPHPSPRNRSWLRRNPHVEKTLLPAMQRRVRELLS